MNFYDFSDFNSDAEAYQPPTGPYLPEASDCMRCGMCLSSCPTYKISADEQEGPRQRVASLRRLLHEQQTLSAEAAEHLENCVQCRACEQVCPSRMEYGVAFDQANEKLMGQQALTPLARGALGLIAEKRWLQAILPLVAFYQISGLGRLLRRLPGLSSALRAANRIRLRPALQPLSISYQAPEERGRVALFSGCLSEPFDRQTLLAAIKVLNTIGYSVTVPAQQVCCGAIHWHNGRRDQALALMQQNVAAFTGEPVDAVVYCATGCGAQLHDYHRHLASESVPGLEDFDSRVRDISEFVSEHWPDAMTLSPYAHKIVVHEPCSQRNVLRNQSSVYRLLEKIPAAQVETLADNQLCCGAGGTYMLSHPDAAQALATLKWKHIQAQESNSCVVSANIGCALHLNHADGKTTDTEVRHPITVIAECLGV